MKCPQCGAQATAMMRFCDRCGASLAAPSPRPSEARAEVRKEPAAQRQETSLISEARRKVNRRDIVISSVTAVGILAAVLASAWLTGKFKRPVVAPAPPAKQSIEIDTAPTAPTAVAEWEDLERQEKKLEADQASFVKKNQNSLPQNFGADLDPQQRAKSKALASPEIGIGPHGFHVVKRFKF